MLCIRAYISHVLKLKQLGGVNRKISFAFTVLKPRSFNYWETIQTSRFKVSWFRHKLLLCFCQRLHDTASLISSRQCLTDVSWCYQVTVASGALVITVEQLYTTNIR